MRVLNDSLKYPHAIRCVKNGLVQREADTAVIMDIQDTTDIMDIMDIITTAATITVVDTIHTVIACTPFLVFIFIFVTIILAVLVTFGFARRFSKSPTDNAITIDDE